MPGDRKVPGQQAHNFASAQERVQPTGPLPAQGFSGAITTGQGPGPALALPPLLSGRPTYQRGLRAQCAGRGPEGWLLTSEAFLSQATAPIRGTATLQEGLAENSLQPGASLSHQHLCLPSQGRGVGGREEIGLGWPRPSACTTPSAQPGSDPTHRSRTGHPGWQFSHF